MSTIIKNGNLFCTKCGLEYKINYPVPVQQMTKTMAVFEQSHAECPQTYTQPTVDQSKSVIEKANWWIANGFVGLSSKAMWCCFMGVPGQNHHPHDPDDFSRCWKLLEAVPEWKAQLEYLRLLSPVWDRLVDNWDKLNEYYEDMRERNKANGMYEFMERIIKGKEVDCE